MTVVQPLELQGRSQTWPLGWLAPEQDRTGPAQSTTRIMVVDDDDHVRMLTARMLREEGYHVVEARSAGQAWERLAEDPEVQVVLTDIAMPGGSGLDLAERIHASAPSPQVILMSGYDRLFPQLGTSGAKFPLLIKPFTPAQLAQQIRAVLLGGEH